MDPYDHGKQLGASSGSAGVVGAPPAKAFRASQGINFDEPRSGQQSRDIPSAIADLNEAIHVTLEDAIESNLKALVALHERLQPVLREVPNTKGEEPHGKHAKEASAPRAPLAEVILGHAGDIQARARRIYEQTEVIKYLIDRLQL